MMDAEDNRARQSVAPECQELFETVESLIELGRRDQADAVMRLIRKCIARSDCSFATDCGKALDHLETQLN